MFFLSTVDRNGSPQAMLGTNMAGDSASMPVGALRLLSRLGILVTQAMPPHFDPAMAQAYMQMVQCPSNPLGN